MSLKQELKKFYALLHDAADDHERAEILLRILDMHSKLSSTDFDADLLQFSQAAAATKNPEHHAWNLFYDGILKRNQGNAEEAIASLEQAAAAFRKINHTSGEARSEINKGIAWRLLANYVEAIRANETAQHICELSGDGVTLALALNNIGNAYMFLGDYPRALDSLIRSMELRREQNNQFGISASARNIGNLYFKQGKLDEALVMYRQAHDICERIGEESGQVASQYNIGLVYDSKGEYDKAHAYFKSAAEFFKRLNDDRHYAESMSSYGYTCARLGMMDEAHIALNEAISIFQERKDRSGEASARSYSGIVAKWEKDFERAIRFFSESNQLAGEIGVKDQVLTNYRELTEVFEAMNDFRQALQYHKKAHELEKEILGQQSVEQLTQLNFRHDQAQREAVHQATERILHNILPQSIAEKIKNGEEKIIQRFPEASCLFADMAGFTRWSAQRDVSEVAETLNTIFNLFDELVTEHGAEKIKTIGDCYMCVAGLPEPCSDHAARLARLALAMNEKIKKTWPNGEIKLRIGIHSGEVIAGVLGKNKYAYDLWGDTVNTASRMESSGEPGKVNLSEATKNLLGSQFSCQYRGEFSVKGKGEMKMYFLDGEMMTAESDAANDIEVKLAE